MTTSYKAVSRVNFDSELGRITAKYLEVAYTSDSFMRLDKELNGVSTDQSRGGRAVTWNTTPGSWAIVKGKLARTTTASAASYAFLPVEIDNYEVEATVSTLPTSNAVYLCGRVKSASATADCYRIAIEATRVVLQKYISGVSTDIAIGPPLSAGDKVQLSVTGNSIAGVVNGVTFGTFTDATITAGGYTGLSTSSAVSQFELDAVVVRAPDNGLKFAGGTASNGGDGSYSFNYSTTFLDSDGWYFNPWKTGNSIQNEELIITQKGVVDYVLPVTEGDLVEAAATVLSMNGAAQMGIYFTKGSPRDDTATYLTSITKKLAVGGDSINLVKANAPAGADHAFVWFEGLDAIDVRVGSMWVRVTDMDLVVDSSTTTPTTFTQIYNTSFGDSTGWYFPPEKPGASIANGVATASSKGVMRTTVPAKPGEWFQVSLTPTALSGVCEVGIEFSVGLDDEHGHTRLETHKGRIKTVGTQAVVTAQAPHRTMYAKAVISAEANSSVSTKGLTIGKASGQLEPLVVENPDVPCTVAGAPTSLKPGISLMSPRNRDYLLQNNIASRSVIGAPAAMPVPAADGTYPYGNDKHAPGRKIWSMMGEDKNQSGIDCTAWNIPSMTIDTNLPPGKVSEGGGGYVIRNVKQFDIDQLTLWERPWDSDRNGNNYNEFMTQIPFPINFHPAAWANAEDGDKSAEWYDIGKDQFYGGWVWESREGEWRFCNAAKTDPGYRTRYHGQFQYGSLVATGQVITPYQLGIEETYDWLDRDIPIPHCIGIAIPETEGVWDNFSYPAIYSDANSPVEVGILEGAVIFLDPTIDVMSLGLPKLDTGLALNLQQYGWRLSDKAGAAMIRGEQDLTGQNRWDHILDPANGYVDTAWFNLSKIPWNYVSVTTKDWGKP